MISYSKLTRKTNLCWWVALVRICPNHNCAKICIVIFHCNSTIRNVCRGLRIPLFIHYHYKKKSLTGNSVAWHSIGYWCAKNLLGSLRSMFVSEYVWLQMSRSHVTRLQQSCSLCAVHIYKIIQIVRMLWLAIKPFYMSVCKHGFRSPY